MNSVDQYRAMCIFCGKFLSTDTTSGDLKCLNGRCDGIMIGDLWESMNYQATGYDANGRYTRHRETIVLVRLRSPVQSRFRAPN